MCERIAIIHQGQIVADEPTPALLGRIGTKDMIIRLDRETGVLPAALESLGAALEGPRTLRIRYNPAEQQAGAFITAVQSAGYGIADISTEEGDLEDVFLTLTASKA